jgi:tRNA(adenine34) deaminase
VGAGPVGPAARAVAEEGLAAGELPIGAVVVTGDQVVGRAFT